MKNSNNTDRDRLAVAANQNIKESQYWMSKLSGPWVKSCFPYRHVKGKGVVPGRAAEAFRWVGQLFQRLMVISNHSLHALHILLAAALTALLHKYTGKNDIIVGTTIYKQAVEGEFINSILALRNPVNGNASFQELLLQVKQTLMEALENQNYPVEILIDRLGLATSPGDFPLFDAAILMQNIQDRSYLRDITPNMLFIFSKTGEAVEGYLEYNSGVYRKTTVLQVLDHFKRLLEQCVTRVSTRLGAVDILTAAEKRQLLVEFNDTTAGYPADKTIHQLFAHRVEKSADSIAVVDVKEGALTYGQLDKQADRLACYLQAETNLQAGEGVGIMMARSPDLVAAIMGVLKAGGAYIPLDPSFPAERIKRMIDNSGTRTVLSQKAFIKTLNRLQWECPSLRWFLCTDSVDVYSEEEREKNELMDKKLWEYVGETASDRITGGGWTSSYTGQPIAKAEMDEYGDNILKKVTPLLEQNSRMRVLEIGCASGISMYRIAPRVDFYYGTDLSQVIIRQNEQIAQNQGYDNMKFACLPAHRIDEIAERDFDLVIMNSVIQHFHGHNYLRKVIRKAIALLKDRGSLFIGDVMDLDRKNALIKDLTRFKHSNGDKNYKTKTDWSAELFISPSFFEDLQIEMPVIRDIEISDKIHTIPNELTKFRFDALLKIHKRASRGDSGDTRGRHKYQHDRRWLSIYEGGTPDPASDLKVTPRSLAYVLYTSGTTGEPKGVLVEHGNVVRLMFNDRYLFDFDRTDVWTMFHSYCFDFSVWEMYGALLYGGKLVIVPPMVVRDPGAFRDLLVKQGVTVLNQTPSAFYNLIAEETTHPGQEFHLKYIIFGGETLNPGKLKKWRLKYPAAKLVNMFGITETTVHVTYKEITPCEIESNISNIGKPIPTLSTYIMDRNLRLLPKGAAGELCVGGAGTARGYLNQPGLTAEKFAANPYKPGQRLYRSGDLARLLDNGDMEYLGRLDHQVQIRGYRIELAEIESKLLQHDDIKEAVVMAHQGQDNEEKSLCAYIVSETEPVIRELRDYLAADLPAYMIPAYFVRLDRIPLVSNGKVDRRAMPAPRVNTTDQYIAPANETQEAMAEIWKKVLTLETVSIKDDFFHLGGDSIKVIRLISLINTRFDANLKVVDIYTGGTIEELSEKIQKQRTAADAREASKKVLMTIEELKERVLAGNQLPADIEDLYPMSDIEKGMVFHYLKNIGRAVYHDQFVYQMKYDGFDPERLRHALTLMVKKHAILRTSFNIEDFEEPLQLVHQSPGLDLEVTDLSGMSSGQQEAHIDEFLVLDCQTPFDVTRHPLWRIRLFLLDPQHQRILLVLVFHHAILDGWSVATLMTELHNTYTRLETELGYIPPGLKSSYKEVVVGEILEKQSPAAIDYWKQELVDYQRLDFSMTLKSSGQFEGMQRYICDLGVEMLEQLKKTASRCNTTVKHLCFGAYIYSLNMLFNQPDITVGLVTNLRPVSQDGHQLLGCFLNTIPVRVKIPANLRWWDYIALIEDKLLEVKRYERMPLFEIVQVSGEKNIDRNPIFDTLFNFMDFHVIKEADKAETSRDLSIEGTTNTNTLFDFEADMTYGRLIVCPKYNPHVIGDFMVKKFCGYFERVLNKFIHEPGTAVTKESIMPPGEREQLLFRFNDTTGHYCRDKTMHQLFRQQVERTPGNTALIFNGKQLSYNQLNIHANRLAWQLRKKGIQPNHLVAVIMERSLEMVTAVMGILKAGGAYVPLEPSLPGARLQKMLTSLDIDTLITNASPLKKVKRLTELVPTLKHILCLDTDTDMDMDVDLDADTTTVKERGVEDRNPNPLATAEDIAYVIFTSGSTGTPKGVVETHRPVVNVIQWVNRTFNVNEADKLLFITSLSFDLSVYDIFGILASGASLRVAAGEDIKDPASLLDIMMEEGITFWDSAPAALQQMVPDLSDLSHYPQKSRLRLVFLSGDWIPVTLPGILQEAFPGVQVVSLGGATEAAIWSNYYAIGTVDPCWSSIPYGKPIQNAWYYILDSNLNLCPVGVPGDLYIGGECLAKEYKNDARLTAEKFIPNPFMPDPPGQKVYKTGDMARWFADGNMEFLGRQDQQVKIRGFRIELGEIESHLLDFPGVKQAVAVARQDRGGDKYLCAYFVSEQPVETGELRKHLLAQLPEYMVPLHFIPMAEIPLTANGKVNRKALPEPEVASSQQYTAPRNRVEEHLAETWSEVLSLQKDSIGIDSSFFEIGGHSLNATILVSRIHKELKVKIPLAEIFRAPTIRELVQYISGAEKDKFASIKAVEKREYYVLSSAQKRLYVTQQMDRESTAYNLPQAVILEGELETGKIEKPFLQLIRRHESFRTSFQMISEEPVQWIHGQVAFEIEYVDLTTEITGDTEGTKGLAPLSKEPAATPCSPHLTASIIKNFLRPFDLSNAPLMRLGLIKTGAREHILVLDMHHIIADGMSITIFINEFMMLYSGEILPLLKLRYRDYSQWQNSQEKKDDMIRQEVYWLKRFEGKIPNLKLPVDYPETAEKSEEGDILTFEMERDLKDRIKELVSETKATLFIVLLAAYYVLLCKYSAQEDIVVGTPIVGRNHADLQDIIGMFVNMLVMRNFPTRNITFMEFVEEVKTSSIEAHENQDYPFEELVWTLKRNNNNMKHPLVKAVFGLDNISVNMQAAGSPGTDTQQLKAKPYKLGFASSKFAIYIWAWETEKDIKFGINYSTALFQTRTIDKIANHFKTILEEVTGNPQIKIGDIDILEAAGQSAALQTGWTETMEAGFDF